MALIGTVLLNVPDPAKQITSRLVTVTVNGSDLAPVDAMLGPVEFACAEGDAVSAVCTDINVAGSAAPSASTSAIATIGAPPLTVPDPAVVVGFEFRAGP